ncbi:unnamed protein product [Trichogramma brassicae]|uniref:Integrase catalytic domain-containing protein n=1 Tax=Trichogramma brassicae TaxID=86971 RepID=A0A6H5I278_9HYME|nr:unnamed protein product [Trichogramma brassicae]
MPRSTTADDSSGARRSLRGMPRPQSATILRGRSSRTETTLDQFQGRARWPRSIRSSTPKESSGWGGRLHHSALRFHLKHPPILDGSSHLATLVIDWAHARSIHGGFKATYVQVFQRAWLINGEEADPTPREPVRDMCGRPRAKQRAISWLRCQRAVSPAARPFERTGVDYAGPFLVRQGRGKGIPTSKAWVAVFVCLVTKAIHLELVGNLKTDSLLGALTRFVGRRRRPRKSRRTSAGIGSAAVRSFKFHLKRAVGTRHVTYEELNTLIIGVEAVLNSRPLEPVTGDPDDLCVLTPSSESTGMSLLTLPDKEPSENPARQTAAELEAGRGPARRLLEQMEPNLPQHTAAAAQVAAPESINQRRGHSSHRRPVTSAALILTD